jgi:hypothetical protein
VSPAIDIDQYGLEAPAMLRETWALGGYIDHLSPSALAMARRCPRQYQERYIHGRKERPAEATFTGTAVHAGLERNFRQKIGSHADIPLVDLLTWFGDEGFKEKLEAEQESAGEEVFWDTDPDTAKHRAGLMLGTYHREVSPRIQPLAVETMIEVDFGLPVPVIGRFDLQREASTVDWKTAKQKRTKPKEDWRIQAAVYGKANNQPVEFHTISVSKAGSIAVVTPLESEDLLVHPSPAETLEIHRTIAAIAAEMSFYMQMYGPDDPWPTHGRFHQWACDFCGFRRDCPAWEGEA